MPNKENKNQYSLVAKLAYKFITEEKLSFSKAYEKAAYSIIKSDASAVKPCPRSTFIALCENENLKDIRSLKSSNKINKNYEYAIYSIKEWKNNPEITRKEMWNKIKMEFNKTGEQQGQLDIVEGLWEFVI